MSNPSNFHPTSVKGWQYPNQLAAYRAWLSNNATGVKSYTEIGCRWGGMFILVTEWLRRTNPTSVVVAIDPIKSTPFIEEYFEYLKSPEGGSSKVKAIYLREFSTSDKVREVINEIKPDFALIDGDHTLRIALNGPHSGAGFRPPHFESAEFTDQYESVSISYLGIGVLKRRT